MTLRRLGLVYAMQGIAFGLLMPFSVPLLDERGLGAAEMGLVLSIAGLTSLLAYPIWGAIADGWLGRRRTIVLTAITAAIGGLLILLAGSDPWLLTLALSVSLVGATVWFPLLDALTLDLLGDGASGYGRIRVWASAGWAASAMTGGAMWMLVGPGLVFTSFVVASLLVAGLTLWSSRVVVLPGAAASPASEARPSPSLRSSLPLFLAPVLLGFMLGLFITSMGEHAAWRYISLRILDQGGSVFLVGLAAALPAIVEIPVFASSGRLTARMGLRWLFVSGALVAAVLMALVAIAPDPWMVTALRTLDGTSYALRYVAMVLIIGVLLPRRLYALGQSVAWFVYAGIAPIVADAVGGLIYERLGAPVLFVTATAALAMGGAVAWVVLRGPRFGRPRVQPAMDELPAPPPPT